MKYITEGNPKALAVAGVGLRARGPEMYHTARGQTMTSHIMTYLAGMATMFVGLLLLSLRREGRESSVTVREGGKERVTRATRKPVTGPDGKRTGPNSIEALGENVHAVLTKGA